MPHSSPILRTFRHKISSALVIIAGLCLSPCNQQSARQAEPSHPALVLTDELKTRLASADAADGKVDHVIAKCVLCGLHMAGKPEFAVPVGDYSAQLCSEACQKAFAKDPAKALLALKPAEH
jgi:hypothetical protein